MTVTPSLAIDTCGLNVIPGSTCNQVIHTKGGIEWDPVLQIRGEREYDFTNYIVQNLPIDLPADTNDTTLADPLDTSSKNAFATWQNIDSSKYDSLYIGFKKLEVTFGKYLFMKDSPWFIPNEGDFWIIFNRYVEIDSVVNAINAIDSNLNCTNGDIIYRESGGGDFINEIKFNDRSNFMVYPLPASNSINIQMGNKNENNMILIISNILGQNVKIINELSANVNNILTIDVSDLTSGIYIMHFGTHYKLFSIIK